MSVVSNAASAYGWVLDQSAPGVQTMNEWFVCRECSPARRRMPLRPILDLITAATSAASA
jgi:hypothetical protein